jgi:hypothetical protein
VTVVTHYGPVITLTFETEAAHPVCTWPDPEPMARILESVDPRWRDLLMAALDEEDR